MNQPPAHCPRIRAFTLVEVVVALGICTFVLIALVGVLSTGLQSGKDSEDQIQATNLASLIISTRTASPTNTIANFAIPTAAMTNAYANAFTTSPTYIGFDGRLTNAPYAAYQVTCQAGTNATTGTGTSQVYLMLSWPAQASATSSAAKRYELLTYIPIR